MKIRLTDSIKKPKTELQHWKLSWLLWDDMANHGYINKNASKYLDYVRGFPSKCPLCELYFYEHDCKGCCLEDCVSSMTLFDKWYFANRKAARAKYARKIADKIMKAIER